MVKEKILNKSKPNEKLIILDEKKLLQIEL